MKRFLILLFLPFSVFGQTFYSQVDDLFEQKKFVKAERLLTEYIVKNSKDVKAIELLGDTYGSQHKWDKAISQYKILTMLNSNVAEYHYKYGGALGIKATKISKIKALNLIGDIKKSLLKAAELDSKHIETRWALVELYMQLPAIVGGSKNKALKYANELQLLSKLDGYLAKGFIYEYDKEHVLAEKYYRMAILKVGLLRNFNHKESKEKQTRNTQYYQIGKIAAVYNVQLDKGEKCLLTYIKNHSAKDGVSLDWAYVRLAQIYKHKHSKEKALKWIDKAIAERIDFEEAQKERNVILNLEG